ncbi:c-type cytochrome biogenesis protein CcmI [Maricaulis sp. CAU 1757]
MIWLLIAGMASVVTLLLVWPVLRRRDVELADGMGAFDSQADELQRDRELGLLSAEEARTAEREIERRRAQAEGQGMAPGTGAGQRSERLRVGLIATSALAAFAAVAIYIEIGRPELVGARPGHPETMPPGMAEVMAEIDALAETLIAEPDDPQGWQVLGEAYNALGRHEEAVVALQNAVERAPTGATGNASAWAGLAEARFLAAGGTVTPEAREAVVTALEIDPDNVRARFFAAEFVFQAGQAEAAIAAWQELLATTPQNAGYRPMIEARIAAAEATLATP